MTAFSDLNYKNIITREQAESIALAELRDKIAADIAKGQHIKGDPDTEFKFHVRSSSGVCTVFVANDDMLVHSPAVFVNPGYVPTLLSADVLYDSVRGLRRRKWYSLTDEQARLFATLDEVLRQIDRTKRLLASYPGLWNELLPSLEDQEDFLCRYRDNQWETVDADLAQRCQELLAQYKATRPKED